MTQSFLKLLFAGMFSFFIRLLRVQVMQGKSHAAYMSHTFHLATDTRWKHLEHADRRLCSIRLPLILTCTSSCFVPASCSVACLVDLHQSSLNSHHMQHLSLLILAYRASFFFIYIYTQPCIKSSSLMDETLDFLLAQRLNSAGTQNVLRLLHRL